MNIKIDEIKTYIEQKRNEREQSLAGLEMSIYELEMQNFMFLGVDMVIRWINEGFPAKDCYDK